MPLMKGKSDKAFEHNVRTEMHHDKPLKQSLAIAYAMKRKGKKMADGGSVDQEKPGLLEQAATAIDKATGNYDKKSGGYNVEHQQASQANTKNNTGASKLSDAWNKAGFAEGGMATDRSEQSNRMSGHSGMVRLSKESGHESGINKMGNNGRSGGISEAGSSYRSGQHGLKQGMPNAKEHHKETLSEMRSMPNPKLKGLAYGGDSAGYDPKAVPKPPSQSQAATMASIFGGHADGGFIDEEEASGYELMPEEHEMHNMQAEHEDEDMISKIMKMRDHMYSKGGQVANEDHGPNENRLADFSPNQFDDLALRDDLEFNYTGENSGDHLGDEREDHDRDDIVSRIMRSMAKKDRLPNPR